MSAHNQASNLTTVARIYIRVSTESQSVERQEALVAEAKAAGYHIAGVYREKASGARADRPELERMIKDLQPGEVVIAEHIDRISRLPLELAEQLIGRIQQTGARLSIPGLVDLSDVAIDSSETARIVTEAVQKMLLRLALHFAHADYEERRKRQQQGIELAKKKGLYTGRRPDTKKRADVIKFRLKKFSISETAELAGCSEALVKKEWARWKKTNKNPE
ncbi:MAG: recombinase family protein [Betaproteobacteria bacterium]|nr:recombinase family protein [Betaproteobacteria bacterium]